MLQLKVAPCNQDNTDLVSDILEDLGALAITMTDQFDDPILEPEPGSVPLWPHVVLQALFEDDSDIQHITRTLHQSYPTLTCTISPVEETDWERACLVDFKPQRFGQRLWVCPSWLTPPEPHAINLILDPGLAFGTGSHPTTGLCLNWLEAEHIEKKTVIDYGCGSGILGIAALKLGALHVDAVDIDPQALTATSQNAEINQIDSDRITISYPDALKHPADILIANILLAPLLTLKSRFQSLLKPDGVLVISGILANQVHELTKAYQPDFQVIDSHREGDWAMLALAYHQ